MKGGVCAICGCRYCKRVEAGKLPGDDRIEMRHESTIGAIPLK